MWQVERQTWLLWQEASFPREWRAVWRTWHWWQQDSSQPKPSTCKPMQPTASTCSHALHRPQHTHAKMNTHIHTLTDKHTETMEWCHTHIYTHTQQTHTEGLTHIEPDTNLVICCYQKKKQKRDDTTGYVSLCAVKTKKERKIETILTSLLFLSVVFSMKDY